MTTKNPDPNAISMKCRNPAKKCNSMTAVEMKVPNARARLYRCTKCSFTMVVSVGGSFNL